MFSRSNTVQEARESLRREVIGMLLVFGNLYILTAIVITLNLNVGDYIGGILLLLGAIVGIELDVTGNIIIFSGGILGLVFGGIHEGIIYMLAILLSGVFLITLFHDYYIVLTRD